LDVDAAGKEIVIDGGSCLILPLLTFVAVGALLSEIETVSVAITIAFATPCRSLSPSKVTSAFSEAQERLAELKRARMTLSKRGMEKLVWDWAMSRVIESPSVTFV
jgi:hypothetical protein